MVPESWSGQLVNRQAVRAPVAVALAGDQENVVGIRRMGFWMNRVVKDFGRPLQMPAVNECGAAWASQVLMRNRLRWIGMVGAILAILCSFGSHKAVGQEEQVGENQKQAELEKQETGEFEIEDDKLARGLMLSSRAFRAAERKVRPALVTIESFGGVSAVAGEIGGIRNQGEGNTTGVMVAPDGWILTSLFNFIEQPPVITVITHDGRRRVAKLVGRDETRKICLLKIEDVAEMPTPEIVPLTEIEVGKWAISVGVGYGDTEPALSQGIISATNRAGGRAIQTDANISPANYGGPLVDIRGRVYGICVPLNPTSADLGAGVEWYDSGIGFTIPLDGLGTVIERMQQGETIRPAFLGVEAEKATTAAGVLVKSVQGPAEEAGVKEGDIITAFGERLISDMTDLRQALMRQEAGAKVVLTIRREEQEERVEVALGERSGNAEEGPAGFPGGDR